eukprot:GHUV01042140.1.p1 GENE.GHUV01042140.1~~GHUV01042140.1.p1  ORF type:complete len:141 (-),score=17.78 GHUV01042140.1:170-592(-)
METVHYGMHHKAQIIDDSVCKAVILHLASNSELPCGAIYLYLICVTSGSLLFTCSPINSVSKLKARSASTFSRRSFGSCTTQMKFSGSCSLTRLAQCSYAVLMSWLVGPALYFLTCTAVAGSTPYESQEGAWRSMLGSIQ